MMNIPPQPKFNDINFANWQGAFSDAELHLIDTLGSSIDAVEAHTGKATKNKKIRSTKVSWITRNDESQFLWDRLGFVARQLNAKFWNFDLTGMYEQLQFTVYNGKKDDGDHYTWHMDKAVETDFPQRKLALVLQLSHEHEYDGGDLQILDSPEPINVRKEKGIIFAFPSYIMHRVTPVTAGTRKTLVAWFGGPPFR